MRKRQEKGVALIPALLVVAVVTATVAHLSLAQHVWFRQTFNIQDRAQGQAWGRYVLYEALTALQKKRARPLTNRTLDQLSQVFPAPPTDAGRVERTLSDAQSRFNLNNLVQNGLPSAPHIEAFNRLLQSLDLNADLTQTLLDWMDADRRKRLKGAEDNVYLTRFQPYRASNRSLQNISELRLIAGFSDRVIEKLTPFVTALPSPTPININTAPPEVLRVLFRGMSLAQAQRLTVERDIRPFSQKGDLFARAGLAPLDSKLFDVESQYFWVETRSLWNERVYRSQALIFKSQQKGTMDLLWQKDLI